MIRGGTVAIGVAISMGILCIKYNFVTSKTC